MASETDRLSYAKISWWAEFLCLLTTILYVVILAHDFTGGRTEAEKWSSASWLKNGFCISNDGEALDSHTASFYADSVFGPLFTLAAAWLYYKQPSIGKTILLVSSFGMIFHGLGHNAIHNKESSMDMPVSLLKEPVDKAAGRVIFSMFFLAVGPWLGKINRVPSWFCLLVHLFFSAIFAEGIPPQFGFAFVLAYINGWLTISRICNVGCTKKEDVALRVDDGWWQVSIGSILPVPVIFSELLMCDVYFKSMGGHFWYDFAIIALTGWQLSAFWRNLDEPKKAE